MSFYLQMVLFIPFKVYKWKIKLFCRKVIIIALIYFLDTQKPARFSTLKKIQIYLFNLLVSTPQIDYHTVSKFLAVLITSFQKQMFSSTILGGQIVCKH